MAQVSPRLYAALCLLTLSSLGHADSSYPVSINLYSCPINTAAVCTQPGTLSVNGTVYTAGTTINFPAGSNVSTRTRISGEVPRPLRNVDRVKPLGFEGVEVE